MRVLTEKQIKVLGYMAEGLQDKQIADLMGITVDTAKGHAFAVLNNLCAKNRTHAVALGYQHGLLKIEAPA